MALTKGKRKALADAGFTKRDIDDLDGLLADDDDGDDDRDDDRGEVAILRGKAAERFLAGFGSDKDEDSNGSRRGRRSKDDDDDEDDDDDKPQRKRGGGWFG